MPITSITIENFKGIGEKAVTIPIRPITLLFGKNSSGKSTVLQALRYFFEVKNQWPNLGRIEMSGGLNTDLDNFHSLVHRHELDRKIRIRVKNVLNEWDEVVTGWKEGDQEGHYSGRFGLGLNMRHLGPFREVHEDEIPQTPDESRWQKGLGAWDALARDPKLVEKTNHYLKEVLQLGYTIKQPEPGQNFQLHDENNEIDVGLSDVGVGIAQVIPVVVGALDDSPNTFAVEQPELHVHPAVQVALGDVFIDSAKNREQAHEQAIAEFLPKIKKIVEFLLKIEKAFELLEESKRMENPNKELLEFIESKKNKKKYPEFIDEFIEWSKKKDPDPEFIFEKDPDPEFIFLMLKENLEIIKKIIEIIKKMNEKIFDAISNRPILIETHSEHLLLRLLRRVRETMRRRRRAETAESEQPCYELTPDDLSVIYVRPTPTGIKFTPINVTEDGDFDAPWPEGFFEERDSEWY